MQALVAVEGPHGPRWEPGEVAEPRPGRGEVLIAVRAAGLNRADLAALPQQAAATADGRPTVAGRELAGEVVEVGEGVVRHRVGDRVMAHGTPAFAELVAVDEHVALPVPEAFDFAQAGAAPVGYVTEHNAMITAARLHPGDAVLIQGASSGVGAIGVQIAAALGIGPVIGTSRSAAKLEQLAGLGLDHGVVTTGDWPAEVIAASGGAGVTGVIDHVGAVTLTGSLDCLALGGRLVSVGRMGGGRTEIDLEEIARRRLEVIGVTFRTRTLAQRVEIAAGVERDVLPLVASRALAPPLIHEVYDWEDAEVARAALAAGEHVGKLVLRR